MATLRFNGKDIVKILTHVRSSNQHRAPYGEGVKQPALWLVKDNGIYILSNGVPLQSADQGDAIFVTYAKGYEDPAQVDPSRGDLWDDQYSKIREAVGGDDFVEEIPLDGLSNFSEADVLVVEMRGQTMAVTVESPAPPKKKPAPAKKKAAKKRSRKH